MIKIFDTTLRDGEQSPGYSMNLSEKILMARQLEKMGVDVIEAGFPIASPGDFESVRKIAEEVTKSEICGLARCNEKDIESAMKALEKAKKPRIHVFIATSDIHLWYKLKMTRDEAIKKAIAGIKLAKTFTDRVDFSPEDATRSDRKFLIEILEEAIKAGADTLNIPDTVGYSTPEEFGDLIRCLIANVRGIKNVIVSTHCHNDLGLAVANSLSGVINGARQVECTINGIGERAGNAALEEVVMAIKTRPELFTEKTNIDTTQLLAASKLLTQITGQDIQSNKAIVGRNAFAHEAGIHQHGVLSNRLTYEIMKPEDVGYSSANNLILGKHSGKTAISNRFKDLGIMISEDKLEEIFIKFKALADKKKDIYDEDLIMITTDQPINEKYSLTKAKISSEKDHGAKAKIEMKIGKTVKKADGSGDGPVSALYNGITKIGKLKGKLTEFRINALTPDKDAIGIVNITWEDENKESWHGQGKDTDITIAAGKALIDILNRKHVREVYNRGK